MFHGIGYNRLSGEHFSRTIKPKLDDKILMKAVVGQVRVGGPQLNTCMRAGMFEHTLCDVVSSLCVGGTLLSLT